MIGKLQERLVAVKKKHVEERVAPHSELQSSVALECGHTYCNKDARLLLRDGVPRVSEIRNIK